MGNLGIITECTFKKNAKMVDSLLQNPSLCCMKSDTLQKAG